MRTLGLDSTAQSVATLDFWHSIAIYLWGKARNLSILLTFRLDFNRTTLKQTCMNCLPKTNCCFKICSMDMPICRGRQVRCLVKMLTFNAKSKPDSQRKNHCVMQWKQWPYEEEPWTEEARSSCTGSFYCKFKTVLLTILNQSPKLDDLKHSTERHRGTSSKPKWLTMQIHFEAGHYVLHVRYTAVLNKNGAKRNLRWT